MILAANKLPAALAALDYEIEHVDKQPMKHQLDLGGPRWATAIPASLTDGTIGTKLIWRDDHSGRRHSVYNICLPDGVMATLDGVAVTEVRCGLLAELALRQVFSPGHPLNIGVIGYGRSGKAILEVVSALRPVTVTPLPSPRADPFRDPNILAKCDAIITCANPVPTDSPIAFSERWNARAYVAFDGGVSLGPSFREKLNANVDWPSQLLKYWSGEFQGEPPPNRPLLSYKDVKGDGPHVFYSYGFGAADLVVARELLR